MREIIVISLASLSHYQPRPLLLLPAFQWDNRNNSTTSCLFLRHITIQNKQKTQQQTQTR
jgi:hypothetical protein